MQRPQLRLLSLARSGDAQARCEVARRYLCGSHGFPRHLPSALDHLGHPALAGSAEAAQIVAELLPLEHIVRSGWLPALQRMAEAGLAPARAKHGIWRRLRHGDIAATDDADTLADALQALARDGLLDASAVAHLAASQALASGELHAAALALSTALTLDDAADGELAELAVRLVEAAQSGGHLPSALPPRRLAPLLEARAGQGDHVAAYALGRALCGLPVGRLSPAALTEGNNLRKGAALLLRAADAGCHEAWLHLYRLHAEHGSSVANPQMARFFLEKAAAQGSAEAQRRLGALLLREASCLAATEQALGWLHRAAAQGDGHARQLLHSLVLPLQGEAAAAEQAIAVVAERDPWLATRLRLAREFGLTKQEALSVDPAAGERPWGLVVGRNPFIAHIRRAAPRAVPALTAAALSHLQAAAQLFRCDAAHAARHEGDLRRRAATQRRLFAQLGLDEALFFARASSMLLDTLRLGSKWAFRARRPLQLALA